MGTPQSGRIRRRRRREGAVGERGADEWAAQLGQPSRARLTEGVPRGHGAVLGPALDGLAKCDTIVGEVAVGGHEAALGEAGDRGGPLLVRPGAGRLRGRLGEAPAGGGVADERLDPAEVGPDQGRDMPVAAVLAEQGEGVEEHHVGLVRPGQVGVRREERTPRDPAAGGRRTRQVGGLPHVVGGQHLLAEQPRPGRGDPPVARGHHGLRARRLPGRRDEVRDQGRVEDVERRRDRAGTDATHRGGAGREVGRAPRAHAEPTDLGIDLRGEVAQRVERFEQAGRRPARWGSIPPSYPTRTDRTGAAPGGATPVRRGLCCQ